MNDKVNSDSTLLRSHKPAFPVASISLRIFHMKFQVKETQLLKKFSTTTKIKVNDKNFANENVVFYKSNMTMEA